MSGDGIIGRAFGRGAIRTLQAIAIVATAALAGQVWGQTVTTTTYTYNADGALTRIDEQVDGGTPTTSYLTWDNFVPNAGDASTGTVLQGNGNLLAVGPAPGVAGARRTFAFDAEDRLRGYADSGGAVSYRFHPTWLMAASSLENGDTRRFYYDTGNPAQMTNTEDGDSGLMCAEIGPLRSVSDGGLQVLLSPRKDVAGVYDPAQGTFSPYHYDPFGDDGGTTPATGYDLDDNPHRYAGEYKDPTWGGYYLRARWYDPALHTFISRDPVANLNRYAYTDGNPVARIDPDGLSKKQWTIWRIGALDKWVARQQKPGHVWSRIFLGPVIAPMGLLADPGGFFYQQFHTLRGVSGYLTGTAIGLEIMMDVAIPESGYASYFARIGTDVAVGATLSAANAVSHGSTRFSWRAFGQGMEYTAGGMFYARSVAAYGYRPYNLTLDDVEDMRQGLQDDNHVLVYKVKTNLNPDAPIRMNSPIGDVGDLGWYHEALIGVSQRHVFFSEFGSSGGLFESRSISPGGLSSERGFTSEINKRWGSGIKSEAFQYVGTSDKSDFIRQNMRNPLQIRVLRGGLDQPAAPNPYHFWSRNCQDHVTAVVNRLTLTR